MAMTMVQDEAGAAVGETPFPYVDGLCFAESGAELRRAGLSAAIVDVSSGPAGGIFPAVTEEDVEAHLARLDHAEDWTAGTPLLEWPARPSFDEHVAALRNAAQAADDDPLAFVALRGSDVAAAHATGRVALFLQFQGASPIGADLHRLRLFHSLGLRVLQLTHHGDNELAGGCLSPTGRGLSATGVEAVARMHDIGLVVDLSHASEATALDVARTAPVPVVVSHTGPQALTGNARSASDAVLRAVADTGGAVGIFMMSFWVTGDDDATVDGYVRALRHVADVAGIDAVAVANDFPVAGEPGLRALGNDNRRGVRFYERFWDRCRAAGYPGFDRAPRHVVFPELNSIDRMHRIHDALLAGGFSSADAEKVMGGNWVRVLTDVLG